MARLDKIHAAVKRALVKEGWNIKLIVSKAQLSMVTVDIAAEEVVIWTR